MDFKRALTNCITSSFHPTVTDLYQGKVREVYTLNSQTLGIVVTDRISLTPLLIWAPQIWYVILKS